MVPSLLTLTTLLIGPSTVLGPGNYARTVSVGALERSYIVHVPAGYDSQKPTPVVLALHGLGMTGKIMSWFSGLSQKADEATFIAVYPNGSGPGGLFLGWNAGAFHGLQNEAPDDVAFLGLVLDDVEALLNVDRRRVYAAGMSNGGMMAYRLASEMSDRIAAIASVSGTLALDKCQPKRPVPILHFHGSEDPIVPYGGLNKQAGRVLGFRSVDDTIKTWVRLNACGEQPTVTEEPAVFDSHRIVRKVWVNAATNADVELYTIEGAGHCWPGMHHHAVFCGNTTDNISATDIMWAFFQRHPLR